MSKRLFKQDTFLKSLHYRWIALLGMEVYKESGKPFKSGRRFNTVKSVIRHPKLKRTLCYTFHEDNSYVECWRCKPAVK